MKFSIALALALSLSAVSYFSFIKYKPKAIRELREVKGMNTEALQDISTLPQVPDAENISTNRTFDSQQTTFSTEKTPEEVQAFYENILNKEWQLKEDIQNSNLLARQYKKDDMYVYIWASKNKEADLTYASVEILNHEK